ncbi:NADP-dependent 3-hydroxy acid dehydrogenase YdfG [Paenibacillus sp. UNC496MF]|uniref:SDR family oxidoreductase n=1 Tax=Paenibacillus sp. UNC496MF TaxID=1502753 RepID=UPI0008EFC66A|nr:SDR family oxidoreductase [Paenibacillus sp. UNC496MF]SFJ93301.1 NADP-dependent 3-hydroxy acid dehydrogenase YdfG [Paenibacillus sp. UNC496MF]
MKMNEKVAIITGASSGLGKATAIAFAKEGANIVMAARRPEKLNEAADYVKSLGANVLALQTDISKADQVVQMVNLTLETFGRVDLLINNAAIDYPSPITELTTDQWDQIIGVNLSGMFYASKAVFPTMMKQNSGYIINISSVAGKKGWPNATAYCATKFAMAGFTQALNGEGKPYNIRCSIVYPGGMDTEWHTNPNPKRIDPEAVANFLVHMATQDPRFVVNEAVVSPINEGGYP